MTRPRVAMRKIRDVLRLSFGEKLSRRQVSASLGIPVTTVSDHVMRAVAAGLSWPHPEELHAPAREEMPSPATSGPNGSAMRSPEWRYGTRPSCRGEKDRDAAAALVLEHR